MLLPETFILVSKWVRLKPLLACILDIYHCKKWFAQHNLYMQPYDRRTCMRMQFFYLGKFCISSYYPVLVALFPPLVPALGSLMLFPPLVPALDPLPLFVALRASLALALQLFLSVVRVIPSLK